MVDAVGGVAKIVGVALKIKEAATTARQNKKDCHHIKSRVDILSRTLSHHENNAELMADSVVMAALEALDGILAEALEVVVECQEERSIICVYYTARNLARQLSKVEQRISYLSSDAMLTIMSYQLLRRSQEGGAPHPPPQIYSPSTHTPLQPPAPPQKMSKQNENEENEANKKDQTQTSHMSKQNQDGANKKEQTQTSQVPKFGEWDSANPSTGESYQLIFQKIRDRRNNESGMDVYYRASSGAGPAGKPRSLVNRIGEAARNIKHAAATVLQDRDDCVEIGKLANKVSTLLSQLEGTKMANEPAMRGALETLRETFLRAQTLVTACQTRGHIFSFLSSPHRRLSRELHGVMDQMASDLGDMTTIALP